MYSSHVMIADILLSEISLNMSIVQRCNPLCLGVKQREKEVREGKEGVTETPAKSGRSHRLHAILNQDSS